MNTAKAHAIKSAPQSVHEMHVLVIDDDDFQCDVMQQVLASIGVGQISVATSGADALSKLSQVPTGSIDLMVCDLHMPTMDGFEFMGAAAQKGFHGALIIVSGQSEDVLHSAELVARLRRFKVLGAVAKPVQKADLARLVRLAL